MNKKEPKFHISKRGALSWKQSWGIRLSAILLAMIFCAILTTITTGENPISVYATIVAGAFGTARKTWLTLQALSILLMISLALTPAFKMRFWNIGGEGQVLIGALACAACMIKLGATLPNTVVIPCMLITSVLAGAIWALVPALLKAKWNTNETLSTLMLNYIATQIVAYYIIVWEVPKGSGKVGIINQKTQIGWLPSVFGNKYILIILIALLTAVLMYVYLQYSKQGYEISVVGESMNTARYIGIKVDRIIIRTLAISGGLCGLVGFLLIGGINHTITSSIVGGQGFTAVMVSWLAKFNPIIMIATSFLIIFMGRGSAEIATVFGLNQSYGDIMTGILLFFIIGSEFFVNYKISLKRDHGKEGNK